MKNSKLIKNIIDKLANAPAIAARDILAECATEDEREQARRIFSAVGITPATKTKNKAFFDFFALYYKDVDDLTKRLQDNYNNGGEFEQDPQDRLTLCALLDEFDTIKGGEI